MNKYLPIIGFIIVLKLIILWCYMNREKYSRTLPNLNGMSRNEVASKKNLPMHEFSNMAVPGWKWGKLYA